MIRRAVVEDVPVIAHMLRLLHEESPQYNEVPIDAEYVTQNLIEMIEREDIVFLTEPGQGFIIGQVGSTWYDPRPRLVEQLIYCLPVHRGMGGFVRLIKAFEAAGREAGVSKVIVGVTTGINTYDLTHAYERMGYTRIGTLLEKIGG